MQVKPKSNSVITSAWDATSNVITFTVRKAGANGQSDAALALDLNKVSEKNRARAMAHGFIQRVSDRAALSRNTTNGQSATPAEKLAAMKGLVDFLASGTDEWAPERVGGVKGPTGLDPLLIAAVAEATGRSTDEVRELVAKGAEKKSVTKAVYLATLGGAGTVKPIVERMRAEQASAFEVDADELLNEVMGGEQQGE